MALIKGAKKPALPIMSKEAAPGRRWWTNVSQLILTGAVQNGPFRQAAVLARSPSGPEMGGLSGELNESLVHSLHNWGNKSHCGFSAEAV